MTNNHNNSLLTFSNATIVRSKLPNINKRRCGTRFFELR